MRLYLIVCRIMLCLLFQAAAGSRAVAAREGSRTLPPGAVEGRLPGGMRYILMRNALPAHKIEMRLVMRVGSLVEDDDQKGCAHYLEHLAFEGTARFPGRTLVQAFESHGMKYGRDINAFTGFDRTVYALSLPAVDDRRREAILQLALRAVGDWLGAIDLSGPKVDAERGVIIEELRGYVLPDDFYTLKIGTGRHSRRMPLGSERDINAVTPHALKRYYDRWYGPHNATLIIVGDVDVDATRRLLTTTLGSLHHTGRPSAPPRYPLTYDRGMSCKMLTDSMCSKQRLELIVPHTMPFATNAHNRMAPERMNMVRALLEERLRAGGIRCDVDNGWYLADKHHFTFSFVAASDTALLRHVRNVSAECRRIVKRGVCRAELGQIVARQQARIAAERTDKTSAERCEDLIDDALHGESRIYDEAEARRLRAMLGKTTSADIVGIMKTLLRQMQKTCLAAYTCNGRRPLACRRIAEAWAAGQRACVGSYVFRPLQTSTTEVPIRCPVWNKMEYRPEAGAIVSRTLHANTGVTDLRLANGLRLLLKPTPAADSTLYVAWIGRGGTADLTTAQQKRYHDAVGYVDMGGIQDLPADTIAAIMMHNELSMAMGTDPYWHQILASGPAANSGALFYLMREKMTHPMLDREAFESLRQDEIDGAGGESLLRRLMRRDTDRRIDACLDSILGCGENQEPKMSRADWQQLCIDTLADYYKRSFADMAHTTLIATGNYDLEKIVAQTAAVFSQMPRQACLPLNNSPAPLPAEAVHRVFADGGDHKATLNMVMALRYEPGLKASLCLKLMRDLLQERLINVLREQLHIVYSPYVDLYYNGTPQQRAYFRMTIDADKSNIEAIERRVVGIVAQLQESPVSRENLDRMKRSFVVTKQQVLSDGAAAEWRNTLVSLVKNQESPADFDRYEEVLQAISPEDIRQLFSRHINIDNRITLIKTQ